MRTRKKASPSNAWKHAPVLPPQVWEVTEAYMMSLDCPRSLSVWILSKYRQWDDVAAMRATPSDYATAADYHRAACASDWLRKYPALPLKRNKAVVAGKSWVQSERECRVSNRYLKIVHRAEPQGSLSLLLDVAAEFCRDVLGPVPLTLSPVFGPGATVSDPARACTVLDKVTSRLTLTHEMHAMLPMWHDTAWERSHFESDGYTKGSYTPETVLGNKYFLVRKDATTDRACAKGPSFNVAMQLSCGRYMRKRILRVLGYDMARGQDHHMKLARRASMDDSLATVDSSRASDTMSAELISRLLKTSGLWLELLQTLREPMTQVKGHWVRLSKFSAMGNGFTFELETLVFLSLAYAVAWAQGLDAWSLVREGEISVYGDDVILPKSLYGDYSWLLAQVGFTVNRKKSFSEGNFRESCGGDYFNGCDVRTPKLESDPANPADWFSVHNSLKERFCDRYPELDGVRTAPLLHIVRGFLPAKPYRTMFGPKWLGDLVLHGDFTRHIRTTVRTVDGVPDPNQRVGTLMVLAPKIRYADIDQYHPEAQLAYLLYTMSASAPARRPVGRQVFKVAHFDDSIQLLLEDNIPLKAPRWLAKSSYARFFGIDPEGKFVS